MRECFTVQFKQKDGKDKGKAMQAVSEDPDMFVLMKIAFEVSTQMPR